jgi:hypothetical protein
MIVSVVEGQTWKRCRRRWYLTAEVPRGLGLEPIHQAPALQLGTLVQATLSEWTEHPDIDPLKYFFELSNQQIVTVKEHYESNIGASISEIELQPIYDTISLGSSMITNYVEYYKIPTPKEYRTIQTEQRMMISIPNTEHMECEECHWVMPEDYYMKFFHEETGKGLCPVCSLYSVTLQPHFLRATLDTLLQSVKSGKLFPMERKTYERRPEQHRLLHDDQMLAYLWSVNQLFPDQVGGMLYDGLWKRAQPPRGKTVDDLFYRDIFLRPQDEIDEFEDNLRALIDDMVYATQHKNYFPNRRWEGCYDCGMEKLCSAMSRGEDTEYVTATYYHPRDFAIPHLVAVSDDE